MINVLILFTALIILAYLTNYFLVRSFLGYKWRIFVAPGVIIHELSHAFACLITGAKIVKISFFDKDGGSVKHTKSPIPVLSPILISIAPLIVGIIIFYYLGKFIQINNPLDITNLIYNIKTIFNNIDFTNWHNIIVVYLLLSVAVTMTPSWQDLVNMMLPLVIISVIIYLIIRFSAIDFYNLEFMTSILLPILSLAVFILLCLLIVSLFFYILTKLL